MLGTRRPLAVCRLLALGAGAATLLALSACESSQTASARLKKEGAKAAQTTTVKAGVKNPNVRVKSTTVLTSANGSAVVVALQNTGAADQVTVPVQIRAKDAKGKVVYKNDLDGLQPALQQVALLRKGATQYWVNDQVTAATPPKTATVAVGSPKGKPSATLPKITLTRVKMDSDESGDFVSGIVRNESKQPQVNMPIYGVVRRGTRIVAAGRALIERLNPEPQKKPTIFRIFFIGKPKGGKLSLEPEPTVLRAEGS